MEEKKQGWKTKLFLLLMRMIKMLFPGVLLLSLSSRLYRCKRVTKYKYFSRQILKNYILAALFTLPVVFSVYKGYDLIVTDKYAKKTISIYLKKNRLSPTFINNLKAYNYAKKVTKKDSKRIRGYKRQTAARFLGVKILIGSTFLLSFFFGILVEFGHPLVYRSKKLKKIMLQAGYLSKEDIHKITVFATPEGFLLDITGHTAREMKEADKLWAPLNIKIDSWIEDPKQRSIVFFKKSYELPATIMY